MSNHEFKIGDIVSLKSHPYFPNVTKIVISGDHQTLPPLMVIVEILNDTRDSYDEQTGEELTNKNKGQCRCIWYSNKSAQYEEAWLHTGHLKVISASNNSDENNERIIESDLVVLKSYNLELSKRKSSLSIDAKNNEHVDVQNISALLVFVSPIMQVVSTKKNEVKEPKYNSKTGRQKRYYSERLVKCKWFNPLNNKLSEKYIPVEALSIIRVSNNMQERIQNIIDSKKYFKFLLDDSPVLCQPKYISFNGGEYFISHYDYMKNKIANLNINKISDIEIVEQYFSDRVPVFEDLSEANRETVKDQFIQYIEDATKSEGSHIRIKYKDRNDIVTSRTLKDVKLENGITGKIEYVSGYCFLRESSRTFSIDNIQQIETLNM